MDGCGEQPSIQTTAASEVKVKEPTNGSYECFICNNGVRPQLPHALAAASDVGADGVSNEANLVLNCPMGTGEVDHASCGGEDFRSLCSTCGQETVEQWTPWNQAHTPCEGSGTSGKTSAAQEAADEPADSVPSAAAAFTVRAKSKYLPFKHALLIARCLKLKNSREWVVWCKSEARDVNIPTNPNTTYKHEGWQGYGHWLGTGNAGVKKDQEFLPFKKALLYARSLKLKSHGEWRQWCKTSPRPASIPSAPEGTYKHEGWQGYGHWLGTGAVGHKDQQFLPFKKALLHARSLKLKNLNGWQAWCKSGVREANMPSNPNSTYKHEGWQGYGHWLGTGTVATHDQQFLPFKKSLLCARSLKLKNNAEWCAFSKSGARPANIPSAPDQVYKHEGWQGYGHWLGTGTVATHDQQFLPFKKAMLYARSLKLKGQKAWTAWSKSGGRPGNIPSAPNGIYKHEGWQGYRHWLGTGTVALQGKLTLVVA